MALLLLVLLLSLFQFSYPGVKDPGIVLGIALDRSQLDYVQRTYLEHYGNITVPELNKIDIHQHVTLRLVSVRLDACIH